MQQLGGSDVNGGWWKKSSPANWQNHTHGTGDKTRVQGVTLTSDVLEIEGVDGAGDWVDVIIADGAGTKNLETAEKSIVSHGEDLIGNPNVVSTLETIRSVSDPEVWKTWLVALIILQVDLVDVKLCEVRSHILEEVHEDGGTDVDALELQLGKVRETLDVSKAGVWQTLGGPLL